MDYQWQDKNKINSSIRTNYNQGYRLKRRIEKGQTPNNKTQNYLDFRNNTFKGNDNILVDKDQKTNKKKELTQREKSYNNIPKSNPIKRDETWGALLSKTSSEGQNKRVLNSKTYQSNIFPTNNDNFCNDKRISRKANFSSYNTKTQITTLPGGVKRGYFEIKDDVNFNRKKGPGHLYKMIHDYNSNLDYEDAQPIGQGYNINSFPTLERYQGSYQRGVVNHDIFNLKAEDCGENKQYGKKKFENPAFKSQFEII